MAGSAPVLAPICPVRARAQSPEITAERALHNPEKRRADPIAALSVALAGITHCLVEESRLAGVCRLVAALETLHLPLPLAKRRVLPARACGDRSARGLGGARQRGRARLSDGAVARWCRRQRWRYARGWMEHASHTGRQARCVCACSVRIPINNRYVCACRNM